MERLRRLEPSSPPRWGRLDAARLVAHLADAARLALGEVDAPPQNAGLSRLLRHAPLKQLFVYALPFPRHAPTVPALFVTRPGAWPDDLDALERLLERVAARAAEPSPAWPEHPYFGRLSTRAWGALGYRHTDHHLRQFGV
jgi:hypothetical protein